MPAYYTFSCRECGWSNIRYRNLKKCGGCGARWLWRSEPRPGRTAAQVLDAFCQLFNEIELTDDEVDEELRVAGYDPDEVAEKFRQFVEPLLRRKEEEINARCGE